MDISVTFPRKPFFFIRSVIEEKKQEYIYFKLAWLPPNRIKCDNCYIIYKNNLIGYMRIKEFTRVLTGDEKKTPGLYVVLMVNTWTKIKPIPAKGHRNLKYLRDINDIKNNGKHILLKMYEELEKRCTNQL